jgi:hypothetical protein
METVSVATTIRLSLPEGVWIRGMSKTYCDTSYTKTNKTTRWATKYLRGSMTEAEQSELKEKLQSELGPDYKILVFSRLVLVYKKTPIQVVEVA